jgi:adenylylsulfate kinase-like enzyme
MYARARKGEIPEFTGISAPCEPPVNPDLVLDTGATPLEACAEAVVRFLEQKRVIGRR